MVKSEITRHFAVYPCETGVMRHAHDYGSNVSKVCLAIMTQTLTEMHGASRLQQSAGHPSIHAQLNRGFTTQQLHNVQTCLRHPGQHAELDINTPDY